MSLTRSSLQALPSSISWMGRLQVETRFLPIRRWHTAGCRPNSRRGFMDSKSFTRVRDNADITLALICLPRSSRRASRQQQKPRRHCSPRACHIDPPPRAYAPRDWRKGPIHQPSILSPHHRIQERGKRLLTQLFVRPSRERPGLPGSCQVGSGNGCGVGQQSHGSLGPP